MVLIKEYFQRILDSSIVPRDPVRGVTDIKKFWTDARDVVHRTGFKENWNFILPNEEVISDTREFAARSRRMYRPRQEGQSLDL